MLMKREKDFKDRVASNENRRAAKLRLEKGLDTLILLNILGWH